jgi:hypothetical protein
VLPLLIDTTGDGGFLPWSLGDWMMKGNALPSGTIARIWMDLLYLPRYISKITLYQLDG